MIRESIRYVYMQLLCSLQVILNTFNRVWTVPLFELLQQTRRY